MSWFSLGGRIDRRSFIAFTILAYVGAYVLVPAWAAALHTLFADLPMTHLPSWARTLTVPQPLATIGAVVGAIALIALLVADLSFNVRRLHDLDLSGWFIAIWIVILIALESDDAASALSSTQSLIWYAVLMMVPGTGRPNRFGIVPLEETAPP